MAHGSVHALMNLLERRGQLKCNPSYRALVKIVQGKRLVNKVPYYLILTGQMFWVIHHATNEHQRVLSYGTGQRACLHEPVGGRGQLIG